MQLGGDRGDRGDGALCLGHGEAVARHDDDGLGLLELGGRHVDLVRVRARVRVRVRG